MFTKRKFPLTRLRRLRSKPFIRDMVRENILTGDDLIQPLFIKEDLKGTEVIPQMPGISRFGLDSIENEIEELANLGIKSVALFPVINPDKKDEFGTEAINQNNLICNAIEKIKNLVPEIIIISDVALDPYTSHGHDGILVDGYVDNDKTLDQLVKQSLALAESGADIIAPSDMMDGRIKLIRNALEEKDFKNIILLSYAAKYNSKFYGPFRSAVGSSSNLGKSTKAEYQMDVANSSEALHEVALDISEGADIVMVKPGMPYLDIISKVKETFNVPTFAYQVSGEYSMLKSAIENKWLEPEVMSESLLCFKRAGADAVLTYAAKEIIMELNK
ncbi:MAG: porphobilinogen synthase [SAR86 cluster bacterium]|jgi:porphobilinogen synthase|nr:porphobilinogen synthase [SAR86 cluster bacterium]|tara:strand:+ start:4927 stop:5922 length:996 start_codon:yes stop_codon:yes gene_type:complete